MAKVALITGGSRGIGAAIARRLAADGFDVAITYAVAADRAATVVKEIEATGRRGLAVSNTLSDAAPYCSTQHARIAARSTSAASSSSRADDRGRTCRGREGAGGDLSAGRDCARRRRRRPAMTASARRAEPERLELAQRGRREPVAAALVARERGPVDEHGPATRVQA